MKTPRMAAFYFEAFQCHLLIEKHLREYSLLPELWTSVRKQGLLWSLGRLSGRIGSLDEPRQARVRQMRSGR